MERQRQRAWDEAMERLRAAEQDKVWEGRVGSQTLVDHKERAVVASMLLVDMLEEHGNEYINAMGRLRGALRILAGHDDPDDGRRIPAPGLKPPTAAS